MTRIIYDKTYYQLLGALWSDKMQTLLDDYHQKLEDMGAPTPSRFFETAKDYHEWANYANNKGVYYQMMIDEMIINKFFSQITDELRVGFLWYVYFGVDSPPIKSTHSRSINVSEDKTHVEVNLKFYPWTIKKDIFEDKELWETIEKAKGELIFDEKRVRNMSWRELERDLHIYEIYLNLKKQNKKIKPKAVTESAEFEELEKKYKIPDSIGYTISDIISHCRKAFKDVNLI